VKAKSICIFVFVLFLLFSFFSCSYDLYDETRAKPAITDSHEFLVLLKATGEYTISEEKLEKMVTGLLNPKSEGRHIAADKKVEITDSKKLPIAKPKISAARSAAVEQENVDVYAFTTQNATNGMEGYVLGSTDMRIGNILAVADGKLPEAEEDAFTDIIFDGLAAYIDRTIQEYESIDDAEIQAALENPDLRSVAPPVNTNPGTSGWTDPEWSVKGLIHHWYPNAANVVWAGWGWWFDGEYHARTPVNWHQGNPYNYYVSRAKNGTMANSPSGCGPVAVAQVMAYHGWPKKCAMDITIPNVNMNIKDYVYNWVNMRNDFATNKETDPIEGGAKDVAVLMYHIRKAAGLAEGETTAIYSDVVSAFHKMKYWAPGSFMSYDVNKIRSSLAAKRPVVAYGSKDLLWHGHFWVIDGICRMEYREVLSNGAEWSWSPRDFVHCNVGWGDDLNQQGLNYYKLRNAWYISELFDFGGDRHALIRSTQENYYQYYLKILPGIYPDTSLHLYPFFM
jgi:hypothetical protein